LISRKKFRVTRFVWISRNGGIPSLPEVVITVPVAGLAGFSDRELLTVGIGGMGMGRRVTALGGPFVIVGRDSRALSAWTWLAGRRDSCLGVLTWGIPSGTSAGF
jgi:hypothetical protein